MFHRLGQIFKFPSAEDELGFIIGIMMLVMFGGVVVLNFYYLIKNGGIPRRNRKDKGNKDDSKPKSTSSTAAAPSSTSSSSSSSAVSGLVKVAKTNSTRNRGLFALKPVSEGSIILSESALFVAPSRPRAQLQSAFDTLDADSQDAVWTFEDAYAKQSGGKTLYGIMRTNCFGLGAPFNNDVKEERDAAGQLVAPLCTQKEQAGLFTFISRLNHSCLPNATVDLDAADANKLVVRALRKIDKDEEICVSYLDDVEGKDYSQRRAELQQRFQFDCACDVCTKHGATASNGSERNEDRIRSDSNRRRIQTLSSLLTSLQNDPARAQQTMARILELTHEEGFHVSESVAKSLLLTSQILLDHFGGSPAYVTSAEEFAEKAADLFAKLFGGSSESGKQALKQLDDIQDAINDSKKESKDKNA